MWVCKCKKRNDDGVTVCPCCSREMPQKVRNSIFRRVVAETVKKTIGDHFKSLVSAIKTAKRRKQSEKPRKPEIITEKPPNIFPEKKRKKDALGAVAFR